jgi:hypothetical protein
MTKHYGLNDRRSSKYLAAENFCDLGLHLCRQICGNVADPTQLSGVGGGYVDNTVE